MYYTKPHQHNLYFGTKFGKKLTTWKIQDLCEVEKISPFLLFTHAWRGFDTTSVIHNKGEVYFNPYIKYILHFFTRISLSYQEFSHNSSSEHYTAQSHSQVGVWGGKDKRR